MLLEADELVYDFDAETVNAIGNVKIYYGEYVLDAEKVAYDQKSGRLIATGGVRMLEPGGNILTSERLDITDDFLNGFVESLNLITPDGARFSARSAERRDGNLLIFHQGSYTACRSCLTNSDKPPLWEIKAHRIVYDRAEHVVYYRHARLEFLGIPIAYVPVFFHPDPTVRRKTGFLMPSFRQNDALGVGVTIPYFWNLAPNYDVTFSPTFLTRQGVLGETEWRHRLLNGGYSIRLAGILQQDKDAFIEDGEALSGNRDFRGSVGTFGEFAVSDQWTFGWEGHASTDRTFNRDYRIRHATDRDLVSTVYLTGLSDRNYFDVRGYHFLVQREDTVEDIPGPDYVHDDQAEQALVHPVLDHNYTLERPILGGEVQFDSNLTSVSRFESDIRHPPPPFGIAYAGVAGTFSRAASRATWRSRFIVPGGQLITPFSYLQADLSWIESDDPASGVDTDGLLGRAMPAVGVEYEWPILATLGSTVHTFGPRAQLILRPDERLAGKLPNEDSQSLMFDDTNLFAYDKFAGYDRQEGGTRANLGFLYQGLFPGGASIDALVGQSIQVAGGNSFALRDHALTGLGSGLETDVSDYLGRVTVNSGYGLGFTAAALFDDNNLQVNRSQFGAVGAYGDSVASVGYAYFRESPAAGIFDRREEINAAASVEVTDNWFALGSIVYDMHNESFVSHSLGVGFSDDSLKISAVYSETPEPYSDLVSDRQIFVRVNLRTLGDGGFTTNLDGDR
jgi:LPS-assembly protein